MVGFDVSPVTCPSRTISASLPERSRSRVMKSSQGDCPSSRNAVSASPIVAPGTVALEGGDLGYPARVARIGTVACIEERVHEIGRECGADHPGAEREHVQVVVLDRLV